MPRKPIQTPEEAQRVLQEAVRRAKQLGKIDFRSLSFPKQLAFIEDPSHLIVAACGRRGGKTYGVALLLLDTAQRRDKCQVFYITLTRPSAKRNMWPYLLMMNDMLKLEATFNYAELSMTLKNGSKIILGGANDEGEIERYRGIAMGSPLFVLDEAQAFRPFLKSFITQVLQPATMDCNGRIVMIGTPNAHCIGYFHDAYNGVEGAEGWSKHHWTSLDNTSLTEPLKWIEENVLKLRNVSIDDPGVQREFFAKWVKDSSGLVYPIPGHAIIDELPDGINDWRYVLGMDVGYVDATAFVTMAYSIDAHKVVTVGSHQRSEMIPSAICAEVDRLATEYDYERIVIDPGGGGKFIVEELRKRWDLPAQVAQKRAKVAAIDVLNGDLRSGVMQIVRDSNEDLLHDASLLQWNYERAAKKGGAHLNLKNKELVTVDDRTPDHLLDAQLYAHRDCAAYLHNDEHNPPKPGTREDFDAQEKALWAAAQKSVEDREKQDWWAEGFQEKAH